MARPIPLEVQESIKAFFSRSWSLRAIQKIFPDLSLSVLSRYRKKFFRNSNQAKPGRRSLITTQNMNYIERNLRNSNLDCPKSVQCYLAYIGIQMSMRNIRYILKHKGFKPKRKVKTNFVREENQEKRLAWAKRHRHLTTDNWHGGGVVFWGMITAEEPSYGSTITEGTVNSEVYAEILELSLQDTMAYYGFDKKTFRFQHENASPHASGATHHGKNYMRFLVFSAHLCEK
ncbi:hypothetical protein INT46_003230 [Mucor plumbeus]|uniref:Transposase Tc1-like domain-containing protein n=1 Tax=Mucor plumbeus TaxID=97098 RepID=A0A8H7R2L7_9FUNG|nr:hypothetical protein INT46_003230 [Mucor plumbeus]